MNYLMIGEGRLHCLRTVLINARGLAYAAAWAGTGPCKCEPKAVRKPWTTLAGYRMYFCVFCRFCDLPSLCRAVSENS